MAKQPVMMVAAHASKHELAMATLLAQHGPHHIILLQMSLQELADRTVGFSADDELFTEKMGEVFSDATNHGSELQRYIKEVDFFCVTREGVKQEKCRRLVMELIGPWLNQATDGQARVITWWDARGGFWNGRPN